jgi:hypothetical protein
VESFVPHKTDSYSCAPDPLESVAPHCVLKVRPTSALKGLSPEMDLAFDDMYC